MTSPQGPIIEPDPDGKWRKEPRVFLRGAIIITLVWVGYLYSYSPDWTGIFLGFGTGACFTAWALEVTGNKVPEFMKPGPKAPPPPWGKRRGSSPE